MPTKKTNIHKLVWKRLKTEVAAEIRSWGFVDHPLWEPAWDRYNQIYTYHLMFSDFSNGILESELIYIPRAREIQIIIRKFSNKNDIRDISDFKYNADEWIEFHFHDNWTSYSLGRSSRWNLFGPHSYRIKFRSSDPSQNNIDSVFADLRKKLPLLKAAVQGDYEGWMVTKNSRAEAMSGDGKPKYVNPVHEALQVLAFLAVLVGLISLARFVFGQF